ncbi:uncharacterized protein LOC126811539 [Patella vulgata]|uniref:uncharacterized protein LOC126811539 n=1 Tax=Patella vulgata TaxID=6465 RepID=UPI00217FE54D|nr:uncharacterized protein LOC126811539 [Patella vulgata]
MIRITIYCVLVLINVSFILGQELLSSSACYGVDLPCTSHQLQCPVDAVINIISAQYGYKYRCQTALECTACCWYKEGDCLVEYKSEHYKSLFRNCSLQNRCVFRAPWISHTLCSELHRSLLTSVFSYITYTCVDVYGMGSIDNVQFPEETTIKPTPFIEGNHDKRQDLTGDKIKMLPDQKQQLLVNQYNLQRLSGGRVRTIVICSVVAIVFVAGLVVCIKTQIYKRCVKRQGIQSDNKNKNEKSAPVYHECEPSRYSFIDKIYSSVTPWRFSKTDSNISTGNDVSTVDAHYDRLHMDSNTKSMTRDPNYDHLQQIRNSSGYDHLGVNSISTIDKSTYNTTKDLYI